MQLASLIAQLVLPAMQKTPVRFLDREDALEKGTTAVFWPGEFHGLYDPWGRKELDTTERLSLSLCLQLACDTPSYPQRKPGRSPLPIDKAVFFSL